MNDEVDGVRMSGRVWVDEGGRPAESRIRPLLPGSENSLVCCRLLTGRTHQARVHLLEGSAGGSDQEGKGHHRRGQHHRVTLFPATLS